MERVILRPTASNNRRRGVVINSVANRIVTIQPTAMLPPTKASVTPVASVSPTMKMRHFCEKKALLFLEDQKKNLVFKKFLAPDAKNFFFEVRNGFFFHLTCSPARGGVCCARFVSMSAMDDSENF